jgi:hypothetical protein
MHATEPRDRALSQPFSPRLRSAAVILEEWTLHAACLRGSEDVIAHYLSIVHPPSSTASMVKTKKDKSSSEERARYSEAMQPVNRLAAVINAEGDIDDAIQRYHNACREPTKKNLRRKLETTKKQFLSCLFTLTGRVPAASKATIPADVMKLVVEAFLSGWDNGVQWYPFKDEIAVRCVFIWRSLTSGCAWLPRINY